MIVFTEIEFTAASADGKYSSGKLIRGLFDESCFLRLWEAQRLMLKTNYFASSLLRNLM
jgi:hypothetical protein